MVASLLLVSSINEAQMVEAPLLVSLRMPYSNPSGVVLSNPAVVVVQA